MELFNEYYNSEIQFLFDLFCLGRNRTFNVKEVEDLARQNHVHIVGNDYKGVLQQWVDKELLEESDNGTYRIYGQEDRELKAFVAPLNVLEKEYLAKICKTEESKLFFSGADSNLEKLVNLTVTPGESALDFVKQEDTIGKRSEIKFSSEVFQVLLMAILQSRRIRYKYCTSNDPTLRTAKGIPYRIECSAFDGRWWLISYNEDEKRPIKSRLENIKSIQSIEKHNVTEEDLQSVIISHLAPYPVILRIKHNKNALERCFLVFEDMMDMTAFQIQHDKKDKTPENNGREEYELRFRYFRWDEDIIVRKLLYLGEYVKVQSPGNIIAKLVRELRACINN